ncbi:hypothetical protein [Rhodanobacter sp. FW106-PBR-LB-2-11]|uniref:hypothetical protein n=1 Tax=Rhodanobacter sp. FW106-PBR-LB-2-11 TaxID=1524463 RepID=UPI0034E571C6
MQIEVTIAITVDDEAVFRRAAHDRALADQLGQEEAVSYLSADLTSVGQCAIMLLDPGVSPKGCSILDSTTN